MQFIANLRLGPRLALAFASVIAVFVLVTGAAVNSQQRLAEAERWNEHTYKVLGTADAMLLSMVNMETGARGYFIAGQDGFLEPWKAGLAKFDEAWSEAKKLTSDNPSQQTRLDAMRARHQEFSAIVLELQQQRREVGDGKGRRSFEGFVTDFSKGRDKAAMDAFRGFQAEFAKAESDLLAQRRQDAAGLRSTTLWLEGAGTAFALLVASVLGLWVTRSITRPVADAVRLAQAVAEGDLSTHIDVRSQDEIGQLLQSLQAMNASLARVVTQVREGSEGVSTASSQIAQGNQDLSARTEKQASAIQETAATMEELGTTVRQNADHAQRANELAMQASDVAARGGAVVGEVVGTIREISDSSRKISEIINVIDSIAFQTNILALNAAVEAARAGEQGRGFAVVASEVRTLAQRSADAAKEIKALINDSVERVARGTELAGRAGSTISEVVSSVQRVTQLMSEISGASRQQSEGVNQVGDAVGDMDRTTQQNAALVEEMAAAASSLSTQAQDLVRSVSVFRISERGLQSVGFNQTFNGSASVSREVAPPKFSGQV